MAIALLLAAAGPADRTAQAQTQAGAPAEAAMAAPRLVLAFYYPWYGNPRVQGGSGRLFHWDRIDEANRQIASSTHYPALGAYDSHDRELIARHCRWAKSAGVDGFIISWWGRGTFEDQAMGPILDGCKEAGLFATIYHETVPRPRTAESAARDITQALQRFADHPAWLRVRGKPVLFVYGRAVGEIGLDGWKTAAAQVDQHYSKGALLIGDRLDAAAAEIFAGTHTYNTAGSLQGKSLDQVREWAKRNFATWVKTAHDRGRISAITVIPGYDDTKIRKPGLRVERFEGKSYVAQWEAAIAARPDWVLITSWNEWHEGSEIEPSVEDGEEYLKLTAEWAKKFKGR
jgi:hypothetical protein